MSLPQDVTTSINNVHFRQPVDRRYSMYNSMDSYHRKNRGFPSRQYARPTLEPKPDPVAMTPFRYRLLPPDYRPPNPVATHSWRRPGEPPLPDPLPSDARRFSHGRASVTEETPYGPMTYLSRHKHKSRNRRGKKTADTASLRSPEAYVLPKIRTRGMIGGSEADDASLSLDVLTVSRPAVIPRPSGFTTSSERRVNAYAERLPPVSTRSDVAPCTQQRGDQWTEYLTLVRQRVMDRHRKQSRKGVESTDSPAWTHELLSVSAFIDTDSYNQYARTVPNDKQRRGCVDKSWNLNT